LKEKLSADSRRNMESKLLMEMKKIAKASSREERKMFMME